MSKQKQLFTKREKDLVQAAIDGLKNKEIAHRLGVTENTIKVYLSRLYNKLGVKDRWDLCRWGRAFNESERLVRVRYAEFLRELNLDAPQPEEQKPTFENTAIARYDVFRAMVQTTKLTREQAAEILALLLSASK